MKKHAKKNKFWKKEERGKACHPSGEAEYFGASNPRASKMGKQESKKRKYVFPFASVFAPFFYSGVCLPFLFGRGESPPRKGGFFRASSFSFSF